MPRINQAEDAVIRPQKKKSIPEIGPVAVMVSNSYDLTRLANLLQAKSKQSHLMSRLHFFSVPESAADSALIGPIIGAPYAAMLMEEMIAWGAHTIIFWGWCGSLVPEINVGDLIVPDSAYIDEGTSIHYDLDFHTLSKPDKALSTSIATACEATGMPVHSGKIWTTDAIYRETMTRIHHFRQKQALAVEMELSALFAIGTFRKVAVAGLLVVSDDLSTGKWRPGFKSPKFKRARKTAAETIRGLCHNL